ncbi:MAG: putative K(+)-stimulated pyrophosphate-energized sodium pump [Planctomycetota bacterium]|nr:MAG: putative K(+)-stimulated pyrophosphate-energized sodium pump [Planctomycetota bacterium]
MDAAILSVPGAPWGLGAFGQASSTILEQLGYAVPAFGLLALVVAFLLAAWVRRQDPGTERMQRIGAAVREGAMAFLSREYRVLSVFVLVVAALLVFGYARSDDPNATPVIAASFIYGAVSSALAGFFGMRVATSANVRTAAAARHSLNQALGVAFRGGAVMGLSVVGLAVLGLGLLYVVYSAAGWELGKVVGAMSGFSLGASSIALFARVGGGIYTKAADVGADLVGKVEAGIPEDDPRNPATIADNVGDNVGDVAGMGADLFESYVGAIVASMVLGLSAVSLQAGISTAQAQTAMVVLPLVLAGIGIVSSIIGTVFVRTTEGGDPQKALNRGTIGAAVLMLAATAGAIYALVPEGLVFREATGDRVLGASGALVAEVRDFPIAPWRLVLAVVGGLAAGMGIGFATEYYCSIHGRPVREIREQSRTGAATNIIAGLAVGMRSTAVPLVLIVAAIVVAYYLVGLYGVALAAFGMLSTTGIQLAVDAYGPIADNAGGAAEMAGLPPEVRERTDKLDAVGNTTAAIGKGFAIGSAALTALALFAAYRSAAGIDKLDVTNIDVLSGLFVGAMLPFLFSSLAMRAVGRAAMDMIQEVRRQFTAIPELAAVLAIFRREAAGEQVSAEEKDAAFAAADGKPEYGKCVDISTAAAIRQMVVPGLIAVVTPVVVGLLSPHALGGLLAGVTASGVLLAIFMANAGGAWDNAKKRIESEPRDPKADTGKGSPSHKAAVIGDTVGDPFKDTAGPSLNILIKLMSVVALVIAPLLAR